MAGSSFQPDADQEELNHRRSRLKIRRAPSSALPACFSTSFHGSCSNTMLREGCSSAITRSNQPLIFHTFEPEVIVAERAEFMSLVQRLTGSPATRRSLRALVQKQKRIESSVRAVESVPDRKLLAQLRDPLKEGRTIILAPAAGKSCSPNAEHAFTNDSPAASPTCPNCSGFRKSCNSHKPQLPCAINQDIYGANSIAAPSSPYTKQLNPSANHLANHPPSSSISANSATYEENYSAYTSPVSSNSPLSPNSSLTTGNSEGCFSMEEGGASSSCREVLCCLEEEGSTLSTEEDGSIFFVFSTDSYYGNHSYTAAQDELDQYPNFSNAWNPY